MPIAITTVHAERTLPRPPYSLQECKRRWGIFVCSAVSLTSCCQQSMETGLEEGEFGGGDSLPYQKRMWRQFQAKSKPFMSNKLAPSRSEGKKEGGIWIFKKKKQHQNALVRTLSSSQPNLHTSGSLRVGEEDKPTRCGTTDPHISKAPRTAAHGNTAGTQLAKQADMAKQSSPKPTVSHLVQSHHKSSSLGSASLESLQRDPVTSNGDKQQLDGMDSVSGFCSRDTHSTRWLGDKVNVFRFVYFLYCRNRESKWDTARLTVGIRNDTIRA